MDEKDTAQQPTPDTQGAQIPAAGTTPASAETQAIGAAGQTVPQAASQTPAAAPQQTPAAAPEAVPQSAVQPTATMQTPPVSGGQVPPQQPMGNAPYGAPSPEAPMTPGQKQPSPTGALVCGILAIVFCFIPIVGIILGIVAIVLAGNYFKAGGTLGQGKAGRICGIIGIVLSVIMIIVNLITVFMLVNIADSYDTSTSRSISATSSSAYESSTSDMDEQEAAIEEVVAARLQQIKDQDPAVVAEIENVAESTFEEAFASLNMNMTMESCGVDPKTYVSYMLEDFAFEPSYMMVYDEGEGGEGEANFYLTMRDITDILDSLTDAITENTSALSAMSEDQQKAEIGRYLLEATQNADISDTLLFDVDLTYTNGEWVIDEETWDDDITYFFGFM